MIIDEIFYEDEISKRPILGVTSDSTIDKIEINDQEYKFAKQKTLTGKSTIVAENAIDEPILDLSIEGNTFQQQYGGYQLLELKEGAKGSKTDSDGNVLSWEVKDGIVTVNGMSNVFTVLSLDYRHVNVITYKAGTYTITPYYYREEEQRISGCDWKFRDAYSSTDITGYTAANKGIATKTFDTDFKLVHIQLYVAANTQYDNYQYTPAIIKGEYATLADLPPYEPYVGGIPSPNPGQKIIFPASPEIDVVSDVYYDGYTATEGDTIYVLASNYKIYSLEEGKTYRVFVDEEKFKERFSEVGDTIMIGNSIEGLVSSNWPEDYWYYHLGLVDFSDSSDPTSPGRYVFETPEISENFYIAVGNTWSGFSIDDEDSFWSALSEIGIYIQTAPYAETVQTIPAFPQPIKNANDGILPKGYQQVEYIESDGQSYIDTGVKGSSNIKLKFEGTFKYVGGYTFFTGSREAVRTNEISFVTDASFIARFGTQEAYLTSSASKIDVEISKEGCFLNGILQKSFTQTEWSNDYNITIFAVNNAGTINCGKGHKPSRYRIYDGNTLIRDFIPCYRIADNVIGMYDLVNGVFYTNQGTGEFSKGENVGMKLVNTGLNLFAQEELLTDSDFTKTEYEGEECIKVAPKVSIYKFPCNISMGKISISLEVAHPNGADCYVFAIFEDGTSKALRSIYSSNSAENFYQLKNTIQTTSNIVEIQFRFYQIGVKSLYYFKNIMVNVGQPIAYLPYFNNTIPIPGSVTKADGTVVELPMRRVPKMYDNASATEAVDYLKVDRVANKVEYVRGTSDLTFDNTWGFVSRGNHVFMLQVTFGNTVNFGNSSYCNKYKTYLEVGNLANVDYGVTLDGKYYGAPRSVITVKDIRFDNAIDFNNSLKDLPIEIVFCLAEPVTTDITDTDLGQALLDLSTYPHTNFFYVYSDPEVNSLHLSYWRQITPADATDEVI